MEKYFGRKLDILMCVLTMYHGFQQGLKQYLISTQSLAKWFINNAPWLMFDSLAPEKCNRLKCVIIEHMIRNKFMGSFCEVANR